MDGTLKNLKAALSLAETIKTWTEGKLTSALLGLSYVRMSKEDEAEMAALAAQIGVVVGTVESNLWELSQMEAIRARKKTVVV